MIKLYGIYMVRNAIRFPFAVEFLYICWLFRATANRLSSILLLLEKMPMHFYVENIEMTSLFRWMRCRSACVLSRIVIRN